MGMDRFPSVAGGNGGGNGITIADDMLFVDIAARDTFTTNNPSRITDGVYCAVGTTAITYYQWRDDASNWIEVSGLAQGPKGDKGDQGIPGAKVQSASFVGNDIAFTMTDATQVTLPNAASELQGPSGSVVTSASFVGSDIIFGLDDGSDVTLPDAVNELRGPQGEQVNGAGFVGSSIVFTLTDGSTVTLSDATTELRGPQGPVGTTDHDALSGKALADQHPIGAVTGLQAALDGKVDKVSGKTLSDENFTSEEKLKLAGLEGPKMKGLYATLADLEVDYPVAEQGDYAFVDGGVGNPNELYVWDNSQWEKVSGDIATATPAQIKDLLLQNADTNNFGDAELAIVQGAASQTDLNSGLAGKADAVHGHVIADVGGLQDELNNKVDVEAGKGLSSEDYTASEKTKLAGVEEGATSNSDDSALLSRGNHTGTQPLSTISDAGTAASADVTTSREDTTSGRLLKVGDFGLGGVLRIPDADVIFKSGLYRVDDTTTGIPEPAWGSLLVCGDSSTGGVITQTYIRSSNGAMWTRGRQNNTWSSWEKYLKLGDFGIGGNFRTFPGSVYPENTSLIPTGFYYNTPYVAGGGSFQLNARYTSSVGGFRISNDPYTDNFFLHSTKSDERHKLNTPVLIHHSGNLLKSENSTPDTDDEKYMTKKQVIDLLTEKGLLP